MIVSDHQPPCPADESKSQSLQNRCTASLKLSRFDTVSAGLTAIMVFHGVLVWILLMIWILVGESPNEVMVNTQWSSSGARSAESTIDFDPPGIEEIVELTEVSLAVKLDALSTAVSQVSAAPLVSDTTGMPERNGAGDSGQEGTDRRDAEPGQSDGDQIEPWQRWEIVFQATNKQDYAAQLDHFGIELAAFGGGTNIIESATELATHPTRHLNVDPPSEQRLYFSWKQNNPLFTFDVQLLSAAGITTANRNIVRFTPPALQSELVRLEQEHCRARGRSFPDDIAKTVFQSQPAPSGYEFHVISQRYRANPKAALDQ